MFIVVFKNNDILWKWKCFKVSPSECSKSVPMPCRCIKLLSNVLSLSVPLQISSPTMSQSPPPQGREESMHNDGKGIQVSLCFIRLPPKPSKGDKKCRKNAKKPKDSFVFWIHEDDKLKDLLEAAINTIGHGHLEWMIGNWSGPLDASNFTVRYTIPQNSSYKDISIKYTIDYMTLISEVTKKQSALFNLVIEEVKVVHLTFPISNLCSSRSSPTMRTIQPIQRMKMTRMEGKRKWVLNHISHPLYMHICIHHYRKLDHLLRKLNKTSRLTNSKFSMLVMTNPASSSIALYFHPVSIYISHMCTWMSGLLLLWGNFTQYCIHNLTILQGWKGFWCWWKASTLWEYVR